MSQTMQWDDLYTCKNPRVYTDIKYKHKNNIIPKQLIIYNTFIYIIIVKGLE